MFLDADSKGQPLAAMQMSSLSEWNGLLSTPSEVSRDYSGIALWVTTTEMWKTVWKTLPSFGNSWV